MVPRAEVGQPLAVEIVDHPPLRLHALRHPGPLGTITDTYRQLRRWRETYGVVAACPAVGLCYDDLEDEKGLRYYAGALLPDGVPASNGVEILEVPGGRYACYRLVGPFGMIDPTFRLLYGTWLSNSGFEPDDRPAIELYRTAPTMASCRVPVIDLMIPIRAAA
jgi:AraC family transcriptional regulator